MNQENVAEVVGDNIIGDNIIGDNIIGDNIIGDNIIDKPKPRLNKNLLSSQLFILPSIYGYYISYTAIMIGSIICLLTSSLHHYYKSEHKIFKWIDILCVNTIAIYFGLKCLSHHGYTFYFKLMLLFAFFAFFIWILVKIKPRLYTDYYCLTHVFAVTGVMICIKSYDEKISKSLGNAAGD